MLRFLSLLLLLLAWAPSGRAHFNMLLPESASLKRGETATLIYRWGHPFEHQLFDAPTPQQLVVISPDGSKADITAQLEKMSEPAADGKEVIAFRVRYTPRQRGDYTFILHTPPIWMNEDNEFLQDSVRTVLHVQAQKGWDYLNDRAALEVVPLTRPYGLQPGMVIQAQARAEGKPLARALAEIEHYNPSSPARLPPDEHITRTAKTDASGNLVASLTEPGWWCITVQRESGRREHEGQMALVRRRATLWIYVDSAVLFQPAK